MNKITTYLNAGLIKMRKKQSQIWVETVIYTLIGLTVIGLLLAYATPKINETKDKILVQQGINFLRRTRDKIEKINSKGVGNTRDEEVALKKGEFIIDASNETLRLKIKGDYKYSEPNQTLNQGGISILTRGVGDEYEVGLSLSYEGRFNITYNGRETTKKFTRSTSPYNLLISNKGRTGNLTNIDFSLKG